MRIVLLFLFSNSWLWAQWIPQAGDIIFQKLNSSFGSAVEDTTSSPWSHVGILNFEEEQWFVVEAIAPRVRKTPLRMYLERCKNQFAVTRLSSWHPNDIKRFISRAKSHLDKNYDGVFVLDNVDELYCSELIYDAINYVKGNGTIKGKAMDFSAAIDYWRKYFERKQTPIPQGEPGISPADIYDYSGASLVYHYLEASNGHTRSTIFRLLYR